jgi:hypothetical protein
LKRQLELDDGSVFRYADHENSFLNMIHRQMNDELDPIDDREELCDFIRSITKSSKDSVSAWEGDRNMIDMCRLAKRYHYDPMTGGSNSIKKVLPAMMNSSAFLQGKYSRPIYGAVDGIRSNNFRNQIWVQYEGDAIVDPYKLLPRMIEDVSDADMTALDEGDELNEGGAAMTAYGKLQYEDITDQRREQLRAALLRYCELDTLAMVMIYEAWREII